MSLGLHKSEVECTNYVDKGKNFKKDYSHSEWKKLDVKLLNDEIAIVNAMYSRINKKGQTYFTGAAMYSFRKNKDNWKVFSITPLKPYNYFDFN